MYNSSSVVYGLKYQARSMVPQQGDKERHRFFVGTNSVREKNEIHLIEFHEDVNAVTCTAVLLHAPEIWSMATTSAHADIIATAYSEGESHRASVWRIPEAASISSANDAGVPLQHLFHVGSHQSRVKRLVWSADDCTSLVTLVDDAIHLWKLDAACTGIQGSAASFSGLTKTEAGCFDPHHAQQFASVHDRTLRAWDFRTAKETVCIADAHSQLIRDVDYNPNKLHHVVTAGSDRRIKFWDLRRPKLPLKILTGHTHWVYNAKFNRFHDQLLCSGGSDAQVNLWSVLSISSAPLGDLEDYTAEAVKDGDKLIRTYDENEDSVYSVAWSAADAWVFAALSYDGRVVVHHVPPAEKYKILL